MLYAILFYLGLLAFMFIFQRNLQYHPIGKIAPIADYLLNGFEEKILTTSDQTKILSWYKPAKSGQKVILYFHGNAGNLGDRAHRFSAFAEENFGVLAISYRGYAGSNGKTTEAGMMLDASAALDFLPSQNYQPQDIIFFGESLGSSIATQLAAISNPYALILESPPSSVVSVGQRTYWFVPVRLLLKDKFDSVKFAPQVSSPVLIFHGTADRVVPYEEGQMLFNAFKVTKKFMTVEKAGHLDFTDEFLIAEMGKFLLESVNSR